MIFRFVSRKDAESYAEQGWEIVPLTSHHGAFWCMACKESM